MDELKVAMEAVGLYQVQYEQVDKLWNYFSVVTLATAGFVLGSERATRTIVESVTIVAAYLVFCFGNQEALLVGQEQLSQIYQMALPLAEKANFSIAAFKPIDTERVQRFHSAVALSVCAAVFIVAWLRNRSRSQSGEKTPSEKVLRN